jgi:hypothetical protein
LTDGGRGGFSTGAISKILHQWDASGEAMAALDNLSGAEDESRAG